MGNLLGPVGPAMTHVRLIGVHRWRAKQNRHGRQGPFIARPCVLALGVLAGLVIGLTNSDTRASLGAGVPRAKTYRAPLTISSKVVSVSAMEGTVPASATEGEVMPNVKVAVDGSGPTKCDTKPLAGQ